MPMNRDYVGKEYPAVRFEVTPELTAAFADAIGDPTPEFRGANAIAPPTFVAIPQIAAAHKFSDDPEAGLDWATVLHGDQEFEWIEPLVAGREYHAVTRIAEIRGKYPLEFMTLETTVSDADGTVAVRSRTTLIARSGDGGEA